MDKNTEVWRQYYDQALSRPHSKRIEFAVSLNKSGLEVAIDCGCGTGRDIAYLAEKGYRVYGFDINPDAIDICRDRFDPFTPVSITESSFENFDYPIAGIINASSSLFFANPLVFENTWNNLESSIVAGGVFVGDFMGLKDSWASNYRTPTTPLSEDAVRVLFENFDVIKFIERDEKAKTSLGKLKHWHTYSVIAIKRQ
ncbi:methyltransferase domain-containing protein [Marinomonas sp. C2222]|uniref:Methyltransferase domain-containing protein n=1 Tax=Marinomonas sargassi TaxID=2984494 RepID=A0ABT2YRJ1_9GAMM|nr:class I SAM-dependent methyltransferase [Marinomonas sargassi]MCV2402503.1 methyltransferase domain-containing protein [Marinomonas sargassi]